jgi:hypothetical protein
MGPTTLTLIALLVGGCLLAGTLPASRGDRRSSAITARIRRCSRVKNDPPAENDTLPRVSRHHWTRTDLNRVLGIEADYTEQISPKDQARK